MGNYCSFRHSTRHWKRLCWEFNKVEKCLLLPLLGQLLSSSLEAFPSFPGGTQPASKLPGICSSLHNVTPACWSGSRASLLGRQYGRQLCKPTGLVWPPRNSPQRGEAGATAHLATAKHWRVTVGRPGVYKWTPSVLNHVDRAFEDTVEDKENL